MLGEGVVMRWILLERRWRIILGMTPPSGNTEGNNGNVVVAGIPLRDLCCEIWVYGIGSCIMWRRDLKHNFSSVLQGWVQNKLCSFFCLPRQRGKESAAFCKLFFLSKTSKKEYYYFRFKLQIFGYQNDGHLLTNQDKF